MNNNRDKVFLAALLHDIGKFYQRADKNGANKSDYLKDWVKSNVELLCHFNEQKNYHENKHVLWTAQFFLDFENSVFRNLFSDSKPSVMMMAARHHKRDLGDVLEKIIQKADHWASGLDRTKDESQGDAAEENKHETHWDDFKKVRMRSIFDGLFRNKEATFKWSYNIPVEQLELNKSFFPDSNNAVPDYLSCWKKFCEEFAKIPVQQPNAFNETLLNLLYKYTATIPSSTIHLPDVSLFDHMKTVAAFAVCLYDYLDAKNKLAEFALDKNENAVLLVGGDLSGIQAYLYDIISAQASKNLKGRSFYLQLLSDAVIEKLLLKLNLTKANLVYASGGSFYLLAPNTVDIRNALTEFETEISHKIFETHKTALYLAFDYTMICETQLYNGNISIVWKELVEKLNDKKRKRFSKRIVSNYDEFFQANESGMDHLRDAVTGDEIPADIKHETITDEKLPVLKETKEQIELGRILRDTSHFIVGDDKISYLKSAIAHIDPCKIGVHYHFLKSSGSASVDNASIIYFNQTDFLRDEVKGNNNSFGFSFYGGNDFPANENGSIKNFSDLGQMHDKDGIKRLGVLRMDVDNLGQAFIDGFDEKRKTFSRYSTLSRSLDYFFKGFINTIWKENSDLQNYTYIIYSGGDDLFIIGNWQMVLKFAEIICNNFKKWTCNNPALTLSGGMVMVPSKFPIIKAAEMAGDAEQLAKNHSLLSGNSSIEKNSFTFLGMPLNWEIEFPVVKEMKNKLIELNESGTLNRSFFGKISALANMRKEQLAKNQNESWQWIMAYDFSRTIKRGKGNAELENYVNNLRKDLASDTLNGKKHSCSYHTLELLNISSRWAELELRTGSDDLAG